MNEHANICRHGSRIAQLTIRVGRMQPWSLLQNGYQKRAILVTLISSFRYGTYDIEICYLELTFYGHVLSLCMYHHQGCLWWFSTFLVQFPTQIRHLQANSTQSVHLCGDVKISKYGISLRLGLG